MQSVLLECLAGAASGYRVFALLMSKGRCLRTICGSAQLAKGMGLLMYCRSLHGRLTGADTLQLLVTDFDILGVNRIGC